MLSTCCSLVGSLVLVVVEVDVFTGLRGFPAPRSSHLEAAMLSGAPGPFFLGS